jgi:nicotinamide riboside kinase
LPERLALSQAVVIGDLSAWEWRVAYATAGVANLELADDPVSGHVRFVFGRPESLSAAQTDFPAAQFMPVVAPSDFRSDFLSSTRLKNGETLRIAIVGAESTGKSTLAASLAREYSAVCVGEYVRTFFSTFGDCTAKDVPFVKLGYLGLRKAVNRLPLVFFDTDLQSILTYSNMLFNLPAEVDSDAFDLYLVLDNSVAWTADPQRSMPDRREEFLRCTLEALRGRPHVVLESVDRLLRAKEALKRLGIMP